MNGAMNVIRKSINVVVSAMRRPFSFLVDHNLVLP